MKKTLFFSLLVVTLLLAACGKSTPVPTPTPMSTPTVIATAVPTMPVATATVAISQNDKGNFVLTAKQESGIEGVPAGLTASGDLYRGKLEAPVTITEYSDYQCPFCSRVIPTEEKIYEAYVKTGKIKFVFRNFPLDSLHPQARQAAEVALCAGVQGKFWPMHDKLFKAQQTWSGKSDFRSTFTNFAKELGLDTKQFDTCLAAQPFQDRINADQKAGIGQGVRGTPAFFVNEWFISGAQPYEAFDQHIQDALAGKKPEPTPTLTYAQTHPFAPDPDHQHYTYLGDPYMGNPKAPLVIMELSDYQGENCRKHELKVMPELKKKYVDTGKVMIVFKHVLGYSKSLPAAEAAECAGEQGQFYLMTAKLFAESDQWIKGDETKLFADYARALNLDVDKFNACLQNGDTANKVQLDNQIARRIGVRDTPSFLFIEHNRVVDRIPGYLPLAQWEKLLEQVLGSK